MIVCFIFLLIASSFAWLTVVVTTRIDARMFRRPDQPATERQARFETWCAFVRSRAEFDWQIFVSGACADLLSVLPSVRCFPVTDSMRPFAYSVPFLDRILRRARQQSRNRYLLFVNMEVLFFGDLYRIVGAVRSRSLKPHLFLTANPYGVHADRTYDFLNRSDERAFLARDKSSFGHPGWACELFVVDMQNPIFGAFPPFLVGRIRWDNWAMRFAIVHKQVEAVDIGAHFQILHIEHGGNGTRDVSAFTAPGTEYNEQVAMSTGRVTFGVIDCLPTLLLSNGTLADQRAQCRSLELFDEQLFRQLSAYTNAEK